MKTFKIILPAILLALTVYFCNKVPITGRSQLSLISSTEMNALSFQQYDEFLKQSELSKNKENTKLVKTIGAKIQKAVEQYFAQNNISDQLEGYAWEFNLVENPEINAWCMPGGKVVVYTGILPVTKDEAGLAVVMGHEIAHAVAQHGNERMSQGMLQEFGGLALSTALQSEPAETQSLFLGAYGVGSQVGVMLPFSRTHESEADQMGLIFMAMAGYDPNTAVEFWTRMADEGGQKPPEFLSTHPSDDTRIEDIKKNLPEAMKYYKK